MELKKMRGYCISTSEDDLDEHIIVDENNVE